MGANHKHQIDLNNEYPCPSCQGTLKPIILTEAFGCSRCQQIFVVDKNGEYIEQLSSIYPYKKYWQWNGKRWQISNQTIANSYFPLALGVIILLLIIWLPFALHFPSGLNIIFLAIIAVIIAIIPAIIVWISHRR